MNAWILCSVLIPVLGGLLLAILRPLQERAISIVVRGLLGLTAVSVLYGVGLFVSGGMVPLSVDLGNLYQQHGYAFPIAFLVDGPGCIYLLLNITLASLTVRYSRYYLHREKGYRRYFSLILLMVGGSNLLALSGTLDLLFVGWEWIALSSFFLIGFYWNRRQPARNAFLAFIVYRICDVGFLVGAMLTHLLWDGGDRFADLQQNTLAVLGQAHTSHPWVLVVVASLLVFASLGKSAQFPFLNWLPRALEGPTPSSAIFYGALSIHAGVFLLLRTETIWFHFESVRIGMALVGIFSAVIATFLGRTLSNIKAQIAYAAIAQVGVIYLELALGWRDLALVHLVLHSFLRAYQILVSPSVVAHALRVLGSSLKPNASFSERILKYPEKWLERHQHALYRLSLTDFYLWPSRTVSIPLAFRLRQAIEILLGKTAGTAWIRIGGGILLEFVTCVALDPKTALESSAAHFIMVSLAWGLGGVALIPYRKLSLTAHHGLLSSSPVSSFLFIGAMLIIVGMPFSPVFVSEDLVLHWSYEHHPGVTVVLAGLFTAIAIATARVFTKVYFGRHREA